MGYSRGDGFKKYSLLNCFIKDTLNGHSLGITLGGIQTRVAGMKIQLATNGPLCLSDYVCYSILLKGSFVNSIKLGESGPPNMLPI